MAWWFNLKRQQVEEGDGDPNSERLGPYATREEAAGVDAVFLEVHEDPDRALSDGPQSILPAEFEQLVREVRQIAGVLARTIN